MDLFKIQLGAGKVYYINEINYTRATGMNQPYCLPNGKGGQSYFAICPQCENPIQIIGLYKNTIEGGQKPYGKHCNKSIPKLAAYNKEDYLDCPYSSPSWKKPTTKRPVGSKVANEILRLLRDQFDRVIYILSRDTEIQIGHNLARSMLQTYLGEEGWRYRAATLNNLPWVFGLAQKATPLFGRLIVKNGELYKALSSQCPDVLFKEISSHSTSPIENETPKYVQISNQPEKYLNIRYLFYDYTVKTTGSTPADEKLHETIKFWVYEGSAPNLKTLYIKEIEIQTDYFLNLINLSAAKAKRNENYLRIADELIPVIRMP